MAEPIRIKITLTLILLPIALLATAQGRSLKDGSSYLKDRYGYFNVSVQENARLAHKLWVDLDEAELGTVAVDQNVHARVNLSFDFPLFERTIRSLVVNWNGHLSFGNDFDSAFPARYIAPLFVTGKKIGHQDSRVRFRDDGSSFIVQWLNFKLNPSKEHGLFSFQARLHQNGDIDFVYKQIPFDIANLIDHYRLVKIGVEDVFYLPDSALMMYYYVDLIGQRIQASTVVSLKALPTCPSFKDCHSCLTAKLSSKCFWCPALNKCSVGLERYSLDWKKNKCQEFESASQCSATTQEQFSMKARMSDTKKFILVFIGLALTLTTLIKLKENRDPSTDMFKSGSDSSSINMEPKDQKAVPISPDQI